MVAINNLTNPAINGATVNREKYKLAAHNIANSEQVGYAKITAQTAAMPNMNGVQIQGFSRQEQRFLFQNFLEATSTLSGLADITQLIDILLSKIAKPNDNTSTISLFSQFLLAFKAIEHDPSAGVSRYNIIQSLDDTLRHVRDLHDFAYNYMVDLDTRISYAIDECNLLLRNIYELSNANQKLPTNSLDYVENLNRIDEKLLALAELLPIKPIYSTEGRLKIILEKSGQPLLDSMLRQLSFQPQLNKDKFIADQVISGIYLTISDGSPRNTGPKIPLVAPDKFSALAWNFGSGKLSALLKQRNQELLYFVHSLNIFINALQHSLNAKHNELLSAIPRQHAISSRLICSYNDILQGAGELTIPLLGQDGQAYKVAGQRIANFKLDIDNFAYYSEIKGIGSNKFTIKALISEINQYFSLLAKGKRLECNGLYDCKIAVISAENRPESNSKILDFDLDCTALTSSADAIELELKAVKSRKQSDSEFSNDIPIYNSKFSLNNGEKLRLNARAGLHFNLESSTADPVQEILLELQINQGGTIKNCACVYSLTSEYAVDSLHNNMRIPPEKLWAPYPQQGAILHNPPFNAQPLYCALVDAQRGALDSDSPEPGYWQVGSAIDDLGFIIDSQRATFAFFGTEKRLGMRGFNELMALNDLLIWGDKAEAKWTKLLCESAELARNNYPTFIAENLIYELHIRPDISANYKLLGLGTRANIGNQREIQAGFYASLGSNNIGGLAHYLAINKEGIKFVKSEILPALETTLSDYLQKINLSLNNRFKINDTLLRNALARHEAIKDRYYGQVAVDLQRESNNIENYKQNSELNTNISRKANELINDFIRNLE